MRLRYFGFVASLLILAGCARVSTTTMLHADGSFSRKVVYTVSKLNSGLGPPAGVEGEKPKMEKPEDYFKLPAGSDAKIVRSEDKNSLIVTVTRDMAAGSAPLQDIALWGEKGKLMSTSSVSIRKLADGKLEYVETLHAVSPNPAAKQFTIPDVRARIKKALPEAYQKTEIIDEVTKGVTVNIAHALLGPPEPNIFNLLLTQDSTIRRINSLAFASNTATFKAAIPGITDEQAKTMARTLVGILNQDAVDQSTAASQASSPKESTNGNDMTPLTFAVGFSGTVVETNGIVDPLTGDVYWSLLPATLDLGDVQLRLVVQP
jgi:hypothetical protein